MNDGDEVDVVCPHESVGQEVVYTIFRGSDGVGVQTSTPQLTSPSVFSAGDIDGDGWNEYVVGVATGGSLLCIESDGAVVWQRDLPERNRGYAAVSIADLDQDGLGDVVTGRTALLGNGGQWLGTGGTGWHRRAGMSMSIPADIDESSPGLEVACGNTLYASNGTTLWTAPTVPDGLTAVADVDVDGFADIVVLSEATIHLVRADGLVLGWGSNEVPPDVNVAAPFLADLDADFRPEVIVASEVAIAGFRWTGATFELMWSTGVRVMASEPIPTAFDFDCDGGAEVVYRDEDQWYIFDGLDGSILYQEAFPSGTIVEMPVVANIDDDPWAEIIVPSQGTEVRVYEVPGSATPRGIFNQPTYHGTNVLDSGAIPRVEPPHWLQGNSQGAQVPENPADPCGVPCGSVVPGAAAASDLSQCLSGIELTWEPATFPSGAGTYAVYRADSGGTCTDALAGAPLISGLTDTRWIDVSAPPDVPLAYVVMSEDSVRAEAGCGPLGPYVGGLAATTCVAGTVIDAGGGALPLGIGWTLRVRRDGDAAVLHWPTARVLLPGEHVHVHRALDSLPSGWTQVAPEGLLATELTDDAPSWLAFYDVRVANACEEESPPDGR